MLPPAGDGGAETSIASCGDVQPARGAARAIREPAGRSRLVGADGPEAAESWLLQSLIKDTEGFMSRHVERRISLAITRRLVETSVTPNAMTLVSLAIGLLGRAVLPARRRRCCSSPARCSS